MPLNDVFWRRVRETLRAQGRDEAYLRERVHRNKNTYTKWFGTGMLRKVKDIEDIADALGVPASRLLAATEVITEDLNQLRLPFEADTKQVLLEIECDEKGILLRPRRGV